MARASLYVAEWLEMVNKSYWLNWFKKFASGHPRTCSVFSQKSPRRVVNTAFPTLM